MGGQESASFWQRSQPDTKHKSQPKTHACRLRLNCSPTWAFRCFIEIRTHIYIYMHVSLLLISLSLLHGWLYIYIIYILIVPNTYIYMLQCPIHAEVGIIAVLYKCQWTLWRRNGRDWRSCVMLCVLTPGDICGANWEHQGAKGMHLRSQLQLDYIIYVYILVL